MTITGSLTRNADGRGTVRVEEVFDTAIDDLWEACTSPERLARWIADVSGDLRPDGEFRARFTSGWEGRGRVDVCQPPRRLVVTTREDGGTEDQVIEGSLHEAGGRTTLVIEERGLPGDELPAYGAGWQIHVEDLVAYLAGRPRSDPRDRWSELIASYRDLPIGSNG